MVISEVTVVETTGGNKGIVQIFAVIIFMVSVLTLSGSGCAPGPTGTHVEANPEDISRIKKVGLFVKVEKGFAVRLQYVSNAEEVFLANLICYSLAARSGARLAGASATAAGRIGTAIGAAAAVAGEISPDKQATRALSAEAAKMNSAHAIGSALVDKLQNANVFPTVAIVQSQSRSTAQEGGIDTLFVLTVRRWGLRPPLDSKYGTGDKAMAQLELDMNHKLVSSTTEKILWERDELYLDSKSYSLGDFKHKEGLLGSRMEHLLQLVCDRTANEVHRMR